MRVRRSEAFGPRVIWLDLDEAFADPSKAKPKAPPLDPIYNDQMYKNFC